VVLFRIPFDIHISFILSIKSFLFPVSSIFKCSHSSINSFFVQSSIGPSSSSLLLISVGTVSSLSFITFSSDLVVLFRIPFDIHISLILSIKSFLFPVSSTFKFLHSSINSFFVQSSIGPSSSSLLLISAGTVSSLFFITFSSDLVVLFRIPFDIHISFILSIKSFLFPVSSIFKCLHSSINSFFVQFSIGPSSSSLLQTTSDSTVETLFMSSFCTFPFLLVSLKMPLDIHICFILSIKSFLFPVSSIFKFVHSSINSFFVQSSIGPSSSSLLLTCVFSTLSSSDSTCCLFSLSLDL